MKKLINGILEFRKNVLEGYRETFAELALKQTPDTLFIACSDSRVVPNLFASTNPGDLFVLRNIGNMIPRFTSEGVLHEDDSAAAAVEFALANLKISNIIVCGHSECAAIKAILDGREKITSPHLQNWLRHGDPVLEKPSSEINLDTTLSQANQLAQLNILLQIDHLKTYPIVQEKLINKKITIHAWWFDIAKADVYAYEEEFKQFMLIDENEAERIFKKIDALEK